MITRLSALVLALVLMSSCGKRAPLDVPPPPPSDDTASAALF